MDGDDQKTAQIALIENIQREDLNIIEEALGYQALIDRFDMTQEEVAKIAGKSRSAVANTLRLLDLPERVLELLKEKDGFLTAGHARALLALKNEALIIPLAERIAAKKLSVRDTETLVKRENTEPKEELPDITGHAQNRVWVKDIERRTREFLGRKVKITQNDKKRSIEIFYEDDTDMEALLTALCGDDFFAEEQ